jgi:hypothetical protein
MAVGVEIYALAPAVQHHHESCLASKILAQDTGECLSNGNEKQPNHHGLICRDDGIEFTGEREHQMQGLDRELHRQHAFPPILALVGTTGGTMPIIARGVAKRIFAASATVKCVAS